MGMMGFRIPERTAILQLQDEPFVGAEITVNASLRLGPLMRLLELADAAITKDMTALDKTRDLFLPNLIGWNLEDASGPLTADAAGWDVLDIALQLAIITNWLHACRETAGVPAPLEKPPADTTESAD